MCLDEVVEWHRSASGGVIDGGGTWTLEEAGSCLGHPPIRVWEDYSIWCL